MIEFAIGIAVGLVVGSFVPAMYTKITAWFKAEETKVDTDVSNLVK